MNVVSADEALKHVRSGDRIYVHGGAATPQVLIDALVARAPELRDVEIVHLHTEGGAPYIAPALSGSFRHNALFIGPNTRTAVQEGRADYTPIFLSEIPALFRAGLLPLDVALLQVSAPDEKGYCSLGVSVDVALSAAESARIVIAQVNPRLPRTGGHRLPVSLVNLAVEAEFDLPEVKTSLPNTDAVAIGRQVAALIEDGSTLQVGIGTIPNAVLASLTGHRDLGVHTEMFSDGLLPLIESGVVNGSHKSIHQGIVISAFVIGTKRLYDFLDGNPMVELHPVDYTNDVGVISQNRKMVAVNAALSVDLTGQVAADSLGPRFYSGIGGQVDFIRGAARSPGGVPIIALPSTAANGTISRITAELSEGSGVVTTRGDVHWVVTEYGARNLHGRTIRERAKMLIEIAHPNFRKALEDEAAELGYLGPDSDWPQK